MAETAAAVPRDLAELFARCAPAVRRFFSRRGASLAEAEDLTQEVFARLLSRAQGPEPVANVEGYVFQIAANLVAHRGRQEARRRELAGEALARGAHDLHVGMLQQEAQEFAAGVAGGAEDADADHGLTSSRCERGAR